ADFTRVGYENHWYHPINRGGTVVLASSTQIGVETPFGPKQTITLTNPVSGEALLVNNLELRFPLLGANIGGVVFYDLGNVYSTPRQMLKALGRWSPPAGGGADTDFTSHTLGLGLRYRTPVGPVRVDTGYLLNPPTFQYFSPGTNPQVLFQRLPPFHFFFSIGQTF